MKTNNNKKLVKLDTRVKQVGGTLIIKEAQVEDSGKYLCMVNNSVGGESVETVLTVTGNFIMRYNSLFFRNIINIPSQIQPLKLLCIFLNSPSLGRN